MAGRGERWDRDRFSYERDRNQYGDERTRVEERDDYYSRTGPTRVREHSDERYDRRPRAYDDEFVRDRRFYDEEPRYAPRREALPDYERRVVIEKERERDILRDPSPPRRPGTLIRRQSSLDTFDRRPARFYERETREEYPPPARREDYRAPPYVPIPLPRTRGLPAPPPRRYADREYYDEIQIAEPGHYGDEEFRALPERIRERETVTTRRRRDRSRDSHTTRTYSTRSSSVTSSRSSSTSGGTAVKNEYPKKGKTRIPARLASKRALIDLGYPYIEEGNTIVVLKALGQDNIDELLKLSQDYKNSEMEIAAARSVAGNIVEERREEIFVAPPVAAPAPSVRFETVPPPPPGPVIVDAAPPVSSYEVVNKTTVVRDISPARSSTSYTTSTTTPVYVERREVSDEIPVGPFALAERRRSRSRSGRDGREIRAEIRALEAQLHDKRRSDRELVRAERMPDGALVLYEEKVEKVEEPRRGVRIEKDKKGRMAISVPKYH